MPEFCVEVSGLQECMSGDVLIAALAIECSIYFIIFVTGFKFIEKLKLELKKKRRKF
tara:strand:+ start:315 stop:485 length:171 start_codon:yes stop_codon:yes gene_type:complete